MKYVFIVAAVATIVTAILGSILEYVDSRSTREAMHRSLHSAQCHVTDGSMVLTDQYGNFNGCVMMAPGSEDRQR